MTLEVLKGCNASCRNEEVTRAVSTVSTGDSVIRLSFEIKDEPSFKSLQGNPALFQLRASRYPLHLRQQTQGLTHIPIAERSFLLSCLWKDSIPVLSKSDSQLSFQEVLG